MVLVHAALQNDESKETIAFDCSTSHPGRSGLKRLWDLIAPGKVSYEEANVVPATTIDRLVKMHSLDRLDFVKLDLEGGEYNALRGATKSLQTLRPLVVTEHSSQAAELHGYTMEEYFRFLTCIGYTPLSPEGRVVDTREPVPFWYVFLVPSERVPMHSDQIRTSVAKFM